MSEKTFDGKSMKPGGGGRFAKMVSGLEAKGKSPDAAKGIAAAAGRAKYGTKRWQNSPQQAGNGGCADFVTFA